MSVRIARIGKPHGVRGEVTVQLFTDDPESRFAPGSNLSVQWPQGQADAAAGLPETLTTAGFRWNKKVLIARFEEITDRNRAEEMRGAQLYAEAHEVELEDDEWRQDDLLGLMAVDTTRDDREVGKVTALISGAAQDLLELEIVGERRRILIPFVEEIVPEVDLETGRVLLTPPAGLLDLGSEE
ncbi:ribosome maturation factor RimM [Kocuria sp. WRN011]|uniref:Ribosome maturation factor RimM n=1 Tax=Kocuria carniphila TaxID=262208 RepID=A0ABV3V0L1_9MICC|nr:ribosome maturation factor RimM [Kocuria sp. WRN011]PBB07959.1 ribosome maturation factor RimM [Kocuria sp. WRN011]